MMERILKLAKENKISDRKLALSIGISPSTFVAWKNGTSIPSVQNVVKIADFFGISMDYLVGRDQYSGTLEEDAEKLLSIYNGLSIPGRASVMFEALRQRMKEENEREENAQA